MVETAEQAEQRGAGHHEVEVRHDEERVMEVGVHGRRAQEDPGQATGDKE